MPTSIQKTISANILSFYYNKFADGYDSDYPEVKNPNALLDGIRSIARAIGDGEIATNTLLYIIEDEDDLINPQNARYVMTLMTGKKEHVGENFAIRLFYTGTNELESVSTIEENRVVWSADTMENTMHRTRTQYYLGFIYMLCDKSPGFDQEPVPENMLTIEDLIALGIEGELPAELIEVTLDTNAEEATVTAGMEQRSEDKVDTDAYEFESTREQDIVSPKFDEMVEALFGEEPVTEIDVSEETGTSEKASLIADVPENDDTEVVLYTPEEYEDEYDDLATDYEELFSEEMFEN